MNGVLWWTVTMVNTREAALALGKEAVESGLAACAQVEGPVTSIYRWNGALHQDPEMRVVFKCKAEKAPALMEWLKGRHPYEVPEILAWPVERSDPDYRKWVDGV